MQLNTITENQVNFEHGENVYNGLLGMTANDKVLFITITNEDAVTIKLA